MAHLNAMPSPAGPPVSISSTPTATSESMMAYDATGPRVPSRTSVTQSVSKSTLTAPAPRDTGVIVFVNFNFPVAGAAETVTSIVLRFARVAVLAVIVVPGSSLRVPPDSTVTPPLISPSVLPESVAPPLTVTSTMFDMATLPSALSSANSPLRMLRSPPKVSCVLSTMSRPLPFFSKMPSPLSVPAKVLSVSMSICRVAWVTPSSQLNVSRFIGSGVSIDTTPGQI